MISFSLSYLSLYLVRRNYRNGLEGHGPWMFDMSSIFRLILLYSSLSALLWSGDLTILVYEYNYNQLHHHGGTTKLCTSRPLLFLIQHTYRPKSKVE